MEKRKPRENNRPSDVLYVNLQIIQSFLSVDIVISPKYKACYGGVLSQEPNTEYMHQSCPSTIPLILNVELWMWTSTCVYKLHRLNGTSNMHL